ncbi:hypothetical protein L211DRAFT_847103 [Terfezia boudieri ATCC MYA-4762]|uniref:Uncharacterized protein n=1 Tax=Terfezia boudieri ATCC MYA-4762 TaxID=1051890 RepID=A0A3N4LZ90_9PEZI|nr:hypothetical protein L211DRAFT_847103 [Terfezia boudieri ATCC MYA-4762]
MCPYSHHGSCARTSTSGDEAENRPNYGRYNRVYWSLQKEDSNMDQYMNWLSDNITIPNDPQSFLASSYTILLTITFGEDGKYCLEGTTDVAIVDTAYMEIGNITGGLWAGIELKKKIASACTRTTSYAGRYRMKQYLENKIGIKEEKKKDMDTAVTVDEASMDRLGSLKIRKVDPADFLPECDIANMCDIFDIMSPQEIHEWKYKHMMDYVLKTPCWQNMYA